jgi:flagellar hook assembly protein FlgD
VSYSLARDGQVSLTVFDVAGRPVRVLEQGRLQAGRHERLWNRQDGQGREVAAGCYFVRLSTGQHMLVRKLELLK